MSYQIPSLFPTGHENSGFVVTSPSSHYPSFEVLMVRGIPDLHTLDTGQFFPRFRFERNAHDPNQLGAFDGVDPWTRIENVTDEILASYRATFGSDVTKDDIFDYVYGLLHSPDYRTRFAADLKKMLPRIPKVRVFAAFRDAGRELGKLHMDYESVPQHPLDITEPSGADLLVTKMRYAGTRPNVDKTTIVYNDDITIRGIPIEAHEYMLGSRSALDWILERYQVKVDPASKIVNDANDWGLEHGNPRYILELIGSIVTVSLETVRIVKSLPPLDILDAP
jgi:predicted helicase